MAQASSTTFTADEILDSIQNHPEALAPRLLQIHALPDIHARNTVMYPFVQALRMQENDTWAVLCRPSTNLPRTIMNLVLQPDFCGVQNDQLFGPDSAAYIKYAGSLSNLLARYLRYLGMSLFRNNSSPVLRLHGEETLRRLLPIWKTIWLLSPTTMHVPVDVKTDVDAEIRSRLENLVSSYADLHRKLYGPARTNELDQFLIRILLEEFCSIDLSLPREQIAQFLSNIFTPAYTSHVWRAGLLRILFETDEIAGMFFDTCCDAFTGGNLVYTKSDHEIIDGPVAEIIQLCFTFLQEGPPTLRKAASSPEIIEKLVPRMVLVCHRERCFGDVRGNYSGMLFTCLQIVNLLGTSMNAISLDPRVCYVFLNSVLLHYVQWQEFQDGLAVGQADMIMDCLSTYIVPHTKVDLDSLPIRMQRDLRRMMVLYLESAELMAEQLRAASGIRAALVNRSMLFLRKTRVELGLNVPHVLPSLGIRRNRCHYRSCECAAMKPPHHLRVCKGCWAVMYCSKLCQEGDWKDHKDECLVMRAS